MATCTITTIPPPPPPPAEKKIVLELSELEARALYLIAGKQVCNPSSDVGKALSSVFKALYNSAIHSYGSVVFANNSYKLQD